MEGQEMSKLGDDLIQSLKEAVAHAKGDGPGTGHTLGSVRDPRVDHAKSDVTVDGSEPVRPREP